jgi:hypothetical protein
MSFSADTARVVAHARGVCKGWSCALSSDALRANGGLETVCVSGFSLPQDIEAVICALGLRTRILHVEGDVDVLRIASEQCPQLSDLRVICVPIAVQFAPRWPLLTRVVFCSCSEFFVDSIIALAHANLRLTTLDVS